MNFKAIFYIKSPLQYLNAIEARNHYGYAEEESLLILHADNKNLDQLTQLIKRDRWGGIINLNGSGIKPDVQSKVDLSVRHSLFHNNVFSITKLSYLARKFSPVDKVFIGDAGNPLMQHLANVVVVNEVVLLDDGIASYLYAEWRKKGWHGEEPRLKKKLSRIIKRLFFSLRDGLPPELTFYSACNIEVTDRDKLVQNKFDVLRKAFKDTVESNSIFFLGSSLVESGFCTEGDYIHQLSLVNAYYAGAPVVYVAHRREPVERIEKIKHALGWETVLFKYPIECQLVVEGPRPRQLAAFVSSALENCHAIFGKSLPIVSFRFNPNSFSLASPNRGKRIWELYGKYKANESSSFKVVDL
ncbi:MAG: hypothetical protein C0615_08565 [Desulfuromonas sp.]|nr:MAG: hypothetical protein C0615_08565 [Desulfuromonas sp.]